MIAKMINLIYPLFCQVCGGKTNTCNKNLCEDCIGKIKRRSPPFCIKCGKQLPGDPELQLPCRDCKKNSPYFDKAISVFYYDGIVKELVHNFKYKKLTSLAEEFSNLTINFMSEYDIGKGVDLILPIPMHPIRLLARDLNSSHILAKEIAEKLGIRYSAKVLRKTKYTRPQSKLTRYDRLNNLQGSFSLRKNKEPEVRDKNILLVDDLFTTGATINECARILKEAGSRHIEAITLARNDRIL